MEKLRHLPIQRLGHANRSTDSQLYNTTLLHSSYSKRQKLKSNELKRKGSAVNHVNENLKSNLKKDGSRSPTLMSRCPFLSIFQHYSSPCWLYFQEGCIHRDTSISMKIQTMETSYLYSISLQSSGKRVSLSYDHHI